MANQLIKDVHTLVEDVVHKTDQASGFSKMLPTFDFSDVDGQRYDDVEYLPEDYRFIANDGYVSQSDNSDTQDLVDRLIPIRRNKAFNIKTKISTKELRDPRLRSMAADGMSREIRNVVDKYCYSRALQRGQMVQTTGSPIQMSDVSSAEVQMMDNGLGMFKKNIHFSLDHYNTLSDQLGARDIVNNNIVQNAYERAVIPKQVGGFDMATRADYKLNLAAANATGITVNGDQSYTVQTKDVNDQYIDNRQMTLAVNGTISNLKAGDRFTIAGINRVNPEVREDTGNLQTFTVLGVQGQNMTISPAIIASGPFQNCSAQAADTAAITFLNTTDDNPTLFWADQSIKLIAGNLPVPEDAGGVTMAEATTEQGLPMRFTRWYDPNAEEFFLKAVIYFDCEIWLPNQVGILLDEQS